MKDFSKGSGPLGYLENQIDPMALMASICNATDRMMTFEGFSREQVFTGPYSQNDLT